MKFKILLFFIAIVNVSCNDYPPAGPSPPPEFTIEHIWKERLDVEFPFGDEIQPAIANGRVFYAADMYLYCRNLETGELIWRTELGNTYPLRCRKVLIDENQVYFNNREVVYAHDITTGILKWETEIFATIGTYNRAMDQNETHLFYGFRGQVAKINKNTGEIVIMMQITELWHDVQSVGGVKISEDNLLYVPTGYNDWELEENAGNMLCYNSETGEYVWGVKVSHEAFLREGWADSSYHSADVSDCAIDDNYVVFQSGITIWALNRFTGEEAWKYTLVGDGFMYNGIGIKDGRVFAGSNRGNMYCIDVETGELLWQKGGDRLNTMTTLFAFDDKRIYYHNDGLAVFVYDLEDGIERWRSYNPSEDDFYYSQVQVGEGYMVNLGGNYFHCFKITEN